MTGKFGKKEPTGSCDSRVWSESCRNGEYKSEGDKYLCTSCGEKIVGLTHEVNHEIFPHISGDYDNLS